MNETTIKKLKNNPHYKLNDEQKRVARSLDRKPMRMLNDDDNAQIHDNKVRTRKSRITRKKRS